MLDIGSVLSRSFSVYSRRFVSLTSIGCLAMLPVILVTLISLPSLAEPAVYWSLALFQIMIAFLVQAAITFATVFSLHGRPTTMLDSLAGGLARLFPVIGVSFLGAAAVVCGLLLFVVPGLMVAVAIAVVIPVTVLEKHSVVEALKRSLELTKGFRWQVFGVMLLVGIIGGLFSAVMELVFEPLATGDTVGLYISIVVLLQAIPTVLSAVAIAVVYDDLRTIHEKSVHAPEESMDAESLD